MKKKKYHMKFCFRRKIKGFTLLELIVSVSISLIIFTVITSIIGLTGKTLENSIIRNTINNNGEYALDYIEKETRRSINIFPIDKYNIKAHKKNLGFLLEIKPYQDKNNYQYIYYYLDNRTLMRCSIGLENPIEEGIKKINTGNNNIAENIKDISKSYYSEEDKIIHLNIQCENNEIEKNYKSSIYAGLGL